MLYEAGQGWQRDILRAVEWYRRAAASGSGDARINLAYLYTKGIGVEKDPVEAYALFIAADDAGHRLARDNLAALAPGLEEREIAEATERARRYLEPDAPSFAAAVTPD